LSCIGYRRKKIKMSAMHQSPPDTPLGEPQHRFEDTFSAETVIKEIWFPHLLTEREKEQIGPERTAAAMVRVRTGSDPLQKTQSGVT
jgi:hypothetical protein